MQQALQAAEDGDPPPIAQTRMATMSVQK